MNNYRPLNAALFTPQACCFTFKEKCKGLFFALLPHAQLLCKKKCFVILSALICHLLLYIPILKVCIVVFFSCFLNVDWLGKTSALLLACGGIWKHTGRLAMSANSL